MKLSVITVTYNNQTGIGEYLTSVFKNLPKDSEVIVLDNASTDKTLEELRKEKRVKLIESKENLGYAKGNNLAVKEAEGEYLFFLNPDTVVLDGAIEKLLSFAEGLEGWGIISPKLIEGNGRVQLSVRKLPTLWRAIKEYYLGRKGEYGEYAPESAAPVVVESVVGAAILIKDRVFKRAGRFNERYFMYFEDLDLCRKVRRLGLDVIYLPESEIVHRVGGSIHELKGRWIINSARVYHGSIKAWLLYIILRLRPRQ
jgi:GT2 family glycosyltransferase